MSRPRQTVGALSPAMRGALVDGHALQPGTVRGLAARRLMIPGCSRLRLQPTPLGRQVAAMLADLHHMRRALHEIDAALGSLRVRRGRIVVAPWGAGSAADTLTFVRDQALRALACSRRWVP